MGQIICGPSSRGLWQETRPDVYGGIVVSIVDEFAVAAVKDALCEALGFAGTAAMTCSTGPQLTCGLEWYALLCAFLLEVLDHAPVCPVEELFSLLRFPVSFRIHVFYAFWVADHY